MSPEELLEQYEGQRVHQRFNAGFVVLSYIISLIGAGSTLELINRRTGFKGLFNNVILASAAVTMGGVSIWSMHFVGNRAIVLGDNEPEIQITYSTLFTVISFFVPILVLLLTFTAIGNSVSWLRISLGGFLCGSAVCGMHYLGNASIENYTCSYKLGYVVGSAIIAITASTVALSIFFIFRSMWANIWWKRLLSALLLAGAVSGMHWCAALGTEYTLVTIQAGAGEKMQNSTVIIIIIICLAIGACLTIAGLVIFTARKMSESARQAQKITLGAAVFDKEGRILVDIDGLVPSTIITDSFVQNEDQQPFTVAHPYFLWMFQATRNLSGLSTLINGMKRHLAQNTHKPIPETPNTDDRGIFFRGQFCLASVRLADRLRQDYSSTGVLWDEILITGAARRSMDSSGSNFRQNLYEKCAALQLQSGQGSLMFLVHHVQNEREYTQLTMAGYRFAEIDHVSDIIASSMQIKSMGFRAKLRQMAHYTDHRTRSTGVHMGFFAIRPNTSGFDVYVRRLSRDTLPSVSLPMSKLEPWHLSTLKRFQGKTLKAISETLEETKMSTDRETEFFDQFKEGIKNLQQLLRDPLLNDAVLVPGAVELPSGGPGLSTSGTMLTFRIVASAQSVVSNTDYEYIPLSLFNVYQLIKTPEGQLSFIHGVDNEFESIIRHQPSDGSDSVVFTQMRKQSCQSSNGWDEEQGVEGNSIRRHQSTISSLSGSTADLYHSPGLGGRPSKKQQVHVRERPLDARVSATADIELQSNDQDSATTPRPTTGVQASYGGYDTYIDQLLRDALEGPEWRS